MSSPKSPLELAALATVAVPGLRVVGLRAPQYSDEVVSVTGIIDAAGNRWTVTSPHDVIGGLDLEDQDALLRRFTQAHESRMIPFRVPTPVGFARLKDGTRIIVHNDLGGRFMTESDFADPHVLPVSLARSLAQLHNLPVTMYTGIDLPSYSSIELRNRHLAVLDEAASHTLIPANLWNRWEDALNDIALWRFATVPIHGDLQTTNVTLHEGSVRTLAGFTSAHVGDPATDFAWVLAQATDEFLERFREAYSMTRPQCDIHIETRAQLISELALLRWLMHGVHAEDSEIIAQAKAMIADLAEDLGDEPLVAQPLDGTLGTVPPSSADEAPVADHSTAASQRPASSEPSQGEPAGQAPVRTSRLPEASYEQDAPFEDDLADAPTEVFVPFADSDLTAADYAEAEPVGVEPDGLDVGEENPTTAATVVLDVDAYGRSRKA